MIEQMECPQCHGNKWYIWGEPFESHGTHVILTAECAGDNEKPGCEYKIVLGVVDSKDMVMDKK